MKERGMLMNSAMVNAILEGSKTQTRRVIKHKSIPDIKQVGTCYGSKEFDWTVYGARAIQDFSWVDCPYGKVGDQLWVRETFGVFDKDHQIDSKYYYKADTPEGSDSDEIRINYGYKYKPSIHMPRAASRIQLEITDIRVERLNDISEDDCDAECFGGDFPKKVLPSLAHLFDSSMSIKQCFAALWESINGKGSWNQNPWVWVIEFKRIGK